MRLKWAKFTHFEGYECVLTRKLTQSQSYRSGCALYRFVPSQSNIWGACHLSPVSTAKDALSWLLRDAIGSSQREREKRVPSANKTESIRSLALKAGLGDTFELSQAQCLLSYEFNSILKVACLWKNCNASQSSVCQIKRMPNGETEWAYSESYTTTMMIDFHSVGQKTI